MSTHTAARTDSPFIVDLYYHTLYSMQDAIRGSVNLCGFDYHVMPDDSRRGFLAFGKGESSPGNREFFGLGRHIIVSRLPRREWKESPEGPSGA